MILRQYCCPYSLHCGLDIWDLLTTHGKFVSLNSFDSKPPGFPGGSAGKESACSAGDLGSIPGLGRSPEEGNGCPLQYAGLEDSMDCKAHGVAKSRTRLSDFHFHFHPKPQPSSPADYCFTLSLAFLDSTCK